MSNIIVDLNIPIQDGTEVVFRSPVDCSQVTGLKVNYSGGSKEFAFADAHGNNVGDIDHLFAEDAVVKVILDMATSKAFVQNADTNAYLEQRFDDMAIVCDAVGEAIALSDASNKKLKGLTVYGKTTQDGTPTPDAPIELVSAGDGDAINVKVTGKNLFYFDDNRTTHHPDGTFTITNQHGYQEAGVGLDYTGKLTKGTYTVSYYAGHGTLYVRRYKDDYSTGVNVGGTKTFDYDGISYLDIMTSNLAPNSSALYKLQLELGNTATEFEAYKEPQTVALVTPNGLPGIPVSSGGNFTDANGQQWLCDEIDLASGVYVQRIGKELLDGSENWRIDGNYFILDYWYLDSKPNGGSVVDPSLMSSVGLVGYAVLNSGYGFAYAYGYRIRFENMNPDNNTVDELKAYLAENPIEVLVPLKDSTENELSAEELATYVAPHTNKPNTTIYNDAGTGMEVSYVADTKAYIDNKFAELAAAIVNNT